MDLRIHLGRETHRKPWLTQESHVFFATSGGFPVDDPFTVDGLKCCHRRVTMAQYRGVVKPESQIAWLMKIPAYLPCFRDVICD